MFETSRKREYETMTMIIKSPYAFLFALFAWRCFWLAYTRPNCAQRWMGGSVWLALHQTYLAQAQLPGVQFRSPGASYDHLPGR